MSQIKLRDIPFPYSFLEQTLSGPSSRPGPMAGTRSTKMNPVTVAWDEEAQIQAVIVSISHAWQARSAQGQAPQSPGSFPGRGDCGAG